jgi:hypothetical protein
MFSYPFLRNSSTPQSNSNLPPYSPRALQPFCGASMKISIYRPPLCLAFVAASTLNFFLFFISHANSGMSAQMNLQ